MLRGWWKGVLSWRLHDLVGGIEGPEVFQLKLLSLVPVACISKFR